MREYTLLSMLNVNENTFSNYSIDELVLIVAVTLQLKDMCIGEKFMN
jgi:hypothetical protein